MVIAVSGIFAGYSINAYADTEGTVNVYALNIRSGPSTDTAVVGSLKQNQKITIISAEGDWYKISINGTTGYVAARFVTTGASGDNGSQSTTPSGSTGTVNTSVLNVRAGAGTNTNSLGFIYSGTKVNILGTEGKWYKVTVSVNGKETTGYVHSDYINVTASSGSDSNAGSSDTGSTQTPSVTPSTGKGKVDVSALNVRSSNNTQSNVLGVITSGTIVNITGEKDGWYQVTTTINGRSVSGYVFAQHIKLVSDSSSDNGSNSTDNGNTDNNTDNNNTNSNTDSSTGTVNSGTLPLNVRSSASKTGAVIGSVKHGTTVTILATEGDWYKVKVQINGKEVTGYVFKSYVKTSGSSDTSGNIGDATTDKDGYTEVNETVWATDGVNIRKGPGTEYGVIAGLAKGASVTRTGIGSNGWSRVSYGSATAYIKSDYLTTTNPNPNTSGVTGEAVVAYALQFEGNPYVYGGNDLINGVDCSGFTQQVYKHFGINLNRTADAQRSNGVRIASIDDAQPGDLIFYGDGGYAGHVALYIGDGKVIHASSPSVGIIISNYNYRTPMQINRVLN